MAVYAGLIRSDAGTNEVVSLFGYVDVTVLAGATTGSAAHGFGATPRPGNPNPNRDEGYNARASADATNITVTLDAPVSATTIFRVDMVRA